MREGRMFNANRRSVNEDANQRLRHRKLLHQLAVNIVVNNRLQGSVRLLSRHIEFHHVDKRVLGIGHMVPDVLRQHGQLIVDVAAGHPF